MAPHEQLPEIQPTPKGPSVLRKFLGNIARAGVPITTVFTFVAAEGDPAQAFPVRTAAVFEVAPQGGANCDQPNIDYWDPEYGIWKMKPNPNYPCGSDPKPDPKPDPEPDPNPNPDPDSTNPPKPTRFDADDDGYFVGKGIEIPDIDDDSKGLRDDTPELNAVNNHPWEFYLDDALPVEGLVMRMTAKADWAKHGVNPRQIDPADFVVRNGKLVATYSFAPEMYPPVAG